MAALQTSDSHGYGIGEALREANPAINLEVLSIPMGLGASAL